MLLITTKQAQRLPVAQDVVFCVAFSVGAGGANFHVRATDGVEEIGGAPAVDEFTSWADGWVVFGEDCNAFFISSNEGSGDFFVQSDWVTLHRLAVKADESVEGFNVFLG